VKTLARTSLVLVILLVVVSAYLRLNDSGIGCPDWPACYGLIGEAPAAAEGPVESAYQRIVHRLVASLLGIAVLLLFGLSLSARKHRVVTLSLLALTVFLALIGLRSGGLHHPGIVMGNLVGGFLMLGLLGWLVFRMEPGSPRYTQTRIRQIRPLAITALVFLGLQIVLGGLTSANFAATSCQTVPDCHGAWLPDATIYSAFRLNAPHEITESGMAVGGLERIAIHLAHRLGAVLTVVAVIAAAIAGIMATGNTRRTAIAILVLLLAEFGIGVASVMTGLPITLAVAHNWLAALLLLALLKLLALGRERWIPD
jgi:cytochrome c oxidase assembly protein subunit 15